MTPRRTALLDRPEPTVRDVLDAVEQLRGLVERALLAPPTARQWLTIEEAATLAGRSPQCVRGWCRYDRIGTKVRGRWQIERSGLRRLLITRFGEAALPHALKVTPGLLPPFMPTRRSRPNQ